MAVVRALLAVAVGASATSCPAPAPLNPGGSAVSAVAAAQDGENGFMLAGASGVATFIIEDSPSEEEEEEEEPDEEEEEQGGG